MGYDCACDIVALATTCLYVYVGEFLAVKPTDFMQHAGLDFNPLVDQRPHQKSIGAGVHRRKMYLELAHSSGTG